jgi:hypothetical protein
LRAPRRTRLLDRRAARPSGRTRVLERHGRVLCLGGGAASQGGRVGVRRSPGARGKALPLGRRARARRKAQDQVWQADFRPAIPPRTTSRGPRRSPRSLPTATASTTSPATSGSGRPTGSTRAFVNAIEDEISRGHTVARALCRRAARTSATTPTAGATGSWRGRARHPTAPPGTWASAAPGTAEPRLAPGAQDMARPTGAPMAGWPPGRVRLADRRGSRPSGASRMPSRRGSSCRSCPRSGPEPVSPSWWFGGASGRRSVSSVLS